MAAKRRDESTEEAAAPVAAAPTVEIKPEPKPRSRPRNPKPEPKGPAVYVVAPGNSLCGSPRGALLPGMEVRPADFGKDGVAAMERLATKGVLVRK
jgi:hypothetical protein